MSSVQKEQILADIFGAPQRSGEELLFYCPKCKHQKKKLSCNVRKNAFKCWVCNFTGNSIARLVKRYGSYKQKQEWGRYDDKVDLSSISFADSLFGDKEQEETNISLPKEFVTLTGKYNPVNSIPLRYLHERGINKEDILKWKIGYCPDGEYAGRIIVPSFSLEGKINYFIARSYRDDWMKYKNPPLHKNQILFNELYVDWSSDLVLTEGVFDAIIAGNAVPLLGSTLPETSRLFQEIAKHDTPIYVALDPDAEKKAKHLIKDMIQYGIETYKVDVSGFQDVGSMTKAEFLERKAAALPMTQETLFRYQIQGFI
jgi:DNA primase